MVYTVTLNPAIDYVVRLKEVRPGETNRCESEEIYIGGKGINVSIVLKQLGIPSKVLGFVAGFTGEAIEKELSDMGIDTDFVRLDHGTSRINVKIKSEIETELNGQGPVPDAHALEALFDKLGALKDDDILILAGSVPRSLPSDIYERILAKLFGKKIRVIVDAEKDLLLKVLHYQPFLIKPNDHELEEMFGLELKTDAEIEIYARRLQEMGAANVLVSMAGNGAMLLDEFGKVYRCGACKGTVKNSVGAGDSMVAGFVAGVLQGDYQYALQLGTAAGGATAFSDGLASKEKIIELLNMLCGS